MGTRNSVSCKTVKATITWKTSNCRIWATKTCQCYPTLGLGKLEGNYHICLKEGARPFSFSTPRRVAIPLLPNVKEELTRMKALGVIERVEQPTEWCAGLSSGTQTKWESARLLQPEQIKWKRLSGKAPPTSSGTNSCTPCWGYSVSYLGCQFWILADPLSCESALLTTLFLHTDNTVLSICLLVFPQLPSTFSGGCLQFSVELQELSASWMTFLFINLNIIAIWRKL